MSFNSLFSIISIFTLSIALPRSRAAELTLSAAIAEALAHNPEMLSLEAGVAGAKGGVTTARTFANPELASHRESNTSARAVYRRASFTATLS